MTTHFMHKLPRIREELSKSFTPQKRAISGMLDAVEKKEGKVPGRMRVLVELRDLSRDVCATISNLEAKKEGGAPIGVLSDYDKACLFDRITATLREREEWDLDMWQDITDMLHNEGAPIYIYKGQAV